MGLFSDMFGDLWGFKKWFNTHKGGRRYVELNLPDDVDISDKAMREAMWDWVENGNPEAKKKIATIMYEKSKRG